MSVVYLSGLQCALLYLVLSEDVEARQSLPDLMVFLCEVGSEWLRENPDGMGDLDEWPLEQLQKVGLL